MIINKKVVSLWRNKKKYNEKDITDGNSHNHEYGIPSCPKHTSGHPYGGDDRRAEQIRIYVVHL